MKRPVTKYVAFLDPFIRIILLKEGSIGGIIAISSLSSILVMVIPVLTGSFIDCISKDNMTIRIWVLLLLTMFVSLGVEIFGRWYSSRKSLRLKLSLQRALVAEFSTINPGRMGEFMPGEMAAKFIRDTELISSIVRDIVPMATMATVGLACAFCISFGRSILMGITMVLLAIICAVILIRYSRGIAIANRTNRTAMDCCMSTLIEMIINFPGLKAMSAIMPALSRMGNSFEYSNTAGWNLDKENLKFESTVRSIMSLGAALVLSVAGLMALKGILTVGDVIVFQMIFAQTLGSIADAFRIMPLLVYVNEAATSIGELTHFDGKEHDSGKQKIARFKGNVELQNVSFTYGGEDKKVLDDISFQLNENECCALVGANGSGKTTLAKLVGAFSEPKDGVVRFDGVNLHEIDRENMRHNISILSQNPVIFSGTLRENITLGENFSEEDVRWACNICGLDNYISKHAEGYNYCISSPNGLSGGERQRIAAARAIIRKPKILILDEPGNHIDTDGFNNLKKIIECTKGHSSILLITHDKILAALADRVVSIDKT